MATLKRLSVPKDSPLRDISQLEAPFPPSSVESEEVQADEEVDSEDVEEGAGKEVVIGSKSSTLNDQILDLIGDRNEVSKSSLPKKTIMSEAEVLAAERSVDQTLQEIDAKVAAEVKAKIGENNEPQPST
ncbi:hypothetical protein CsSME_00015496 [Camellia sinensis var. sinensis]